MRNAQETKKSPREISVPEAIDALQVPSMHPTASYIAFVRALKKAEQRLLDEVQSPLEILIAVAAALGSGRPDGRLVASQLLARLRTNEGFDLWLGSEVEHG